MAVGNAQIISYLHTMKSQIDSSNFEPLLIAGAAALTGDQAWTAKRNDIYKKRRDIIVAGLRQAGFRVQSPPAAIYVWAGLPEGETDSIDFAPGYWNRPG